MASGEAKTQNKLNTKTKMNEAPTAVVDPLDVNTNDVDITYPIIPASNYLLTLKSVTREATNENVGGILSDPYDPNNEGERLTIVHATLAEVEDRKGNKVPAGLQITSYIGLTAKAERTNDLGKKIRARTKDDIAKDVARLARAAKHNASVRDIINNPSQLDGKNVNAKVGIDKETEQFPAKNRVMGYAYED